MAGKPTHIAYSVRDFQKDGKADASWSRIGVAFEHKDGAGEDHARRQHSGDHDDHDADARRVFRTWA